MAKQSRKKSGAGRASGGMMMNMRSGMRKMAGTERGKGRRRQWTFQQVLGLVLGVAALLVLVYVFTRA
jgi:hypothetical protein